jgi:hypothetical protein
MKTTNTTYWNTIDRTGRYVPVAAVTLIVALLLLALLGIPRAAADDADVQRGIDAGAARYQAMGQFYAEMAKSIQRGNDASSNRWAAQGSAYAQSFPEQPFPELTTPRVPYTDASKFYVERVRAEIRGAVAEQGLESELAANPELLLARRTYVAQYELAANPELILARAAYVVQSAQSELAANPELILARRGYTSGQEILGCSVASC